MAHTEHNFLDYPRSRKELPIFTYRDEILEAIAQFQCLIIVGDTGSGKTTQVPQYILESLSNIRNICVTQPRRIAAIAAARRVAQERHSRLGDVVGYAIRFERNTSSNTRLVYATDGTLLRQVANDPLIKAYDLIILDEAHERSLETDVLLGLLRRACRRRPELKIVIMSATLDIDKFSDFFGEAPVFSVPGRMFAVDILWQKQMKLSAAKATYVRRAVDTVVHIHKTEEPGDVLVFLTGQQEIDQAIKLLEDALASLDNSEIRYRSRVMNVLSYPLYSAMETPEQGTIFEPAPEGVRKVIFATNIAQTSITVPGIRYVIDSGFVKQKLYDPQTRVDALVVAPISQAAATQRAGRAGRVAAGKVYRLYSREAFEDMDAATVPEIQRSSLLSTVLSLKTLGIEDVVNFEFIDPPDVEQITDAIKQLFLLGAVDEQGHLTNLGRQMAAFPIDPFLSRALISSAIDYGCSFEVIIIVAMLSVEDVFANPRGKKKLDAAEKMRKRFYDPSGDHITCLRVFHAWRDHDYSKDWAYEHYLHFRALTAARSIRKQLSACMEKLGLPIMSSEQHNSKRPKLNQGRQALPWHAIDSIAVIRSFCSAFFPNVARRHAQRSYFYHFPTSRSEAASTAQIALFLHPQSSLAGDREGRLDWVLFNDIMYVNRATMRVVSIIHFEWVETLMGRLDVMDESKLISSGEQRGSNARRSSLSGIEHNEQTDEAPRENPEFEIVHEVIDEMHRSERAVGEEAVKNPCDSSRVHPTGLSNPSKTDLTIEIVRSRDDKVREARERYLQRKGRR
ncbi:P-loop containing nucleoside triphosphate hydrolase protein [Gaertneriomyces semiglobifer]|nr:P-loop containing nucleoside triphosphate hydrolase protein [Gaertneriomyces semiglobifer]